ncbi:MAG: LacI family DNA-binding transcriptional regulator [Alphaproteobacteria bacterium]|nr:LacI family DNA-binding transcriptional regulator [Alphaproteobacteria bacterium]HPF46472.1 LacI family DNA-binding transcriptional regulator [Emcibacteraceae bacterium]HRW30880.1 LacI family DNA-binding transcriptional regulator [Emcibacteraceae bacterium]
MATIRDVSKIAGVSVATVSRTLSKPDKVSAKTRKIVNAAILETNYKPDILARNFRTRKSSTIVVLVPDIANPFFSRVIRGIEQTAQSLDYAVLLGDTQGDRGRESTYANMVNTSQADGIIQLDSHNPFENNSNVPIVNVCDCIRGTDMPTIELDNAAAARKMTDYLISQGHKNIAIITGTLDSTITQDRLSGYKEALKNASIKFNPNNINVGDYSFLSGMSATRMLMKYQAPPTAIFCMNDEMAIGAIKQAKLMGLKIPDDISIAGFDNISFAEYCDPPLTTISQPAEEFGSKAMSMLYRVINQDGAIKKNTFLDFELIIRNSTGRNSHD